MTALLDLNEVTLVTVTGVQIDSAQRALQRSMEGISFHAALLIASEPPTELDPRIAFKKIPPMNLHGYSGFMLHHLHRYIETPYALVVQADGFVLNPGLWDPHWLDYDYVGAPWSKYLKVGDRRIRMRNRVGNGGFSLRTRKLLEITSTVDWRSLSFPIMAEDILVCHALHDYFVRRGFRFADLDTAAAFSIENPEASFDRTLDTAFGFHGKYYLAEALEQAAAGSPLSTGQTEDVGTP